MLWFLAGFLHIPKFQKLLVQSQIAKGVDQLIVTSDFCIPQQVFAAMAHSAQPLLFIMPIVASSPLLGSGQDVNVIFYILDLLGELTHTLACLQQMEIAFHGGQLIFLERTKETLVVIYPRKTRGR